MPPKKEIKRKKEKELQDDQGTTKKARIDRSAEVAGIKQAILSKSDWHLKIRDQTIRTKWIDEAIQQGADAVSGSISTHTRNHFVSAR